MAKIVVVSKTTRSITVYLSGLDADYQLDNRRVDWYIDSAVSPETYCFVSAFSSESDTVEISGLSSGTTYEITAKLYEGTTLLPSETITKSVTTKSPAPSRPSNWSWSSNVLTSLQNKGNINTLTYIEWNEFVDRVQAFLKYKSKSTSTIGNAKMSSTDKVMTAVRFNVVRECINSMNETGISQQNPGDPVMGSYFITLAKKLNDVT